MSEFWESNFIIKREIWGIEPSKSAVITNDFFIEKGIKKVLIPGIGYGRNAQVFQKSGIEVVGIEISKTAINMANLNYGSFFKIYHGSVVDMPFDEDNFNGIFCHALLNLFGIEERKKLISNCFNQLSKEGYMVFSVISRNAITHKQEKTINEDQFEIFYGTKIYFYDEESIQTEFSKYGLFEIMEIKEEYPFYLIKCKNF